MTRPGGGWGNYKQWAVQDSIQSDPDQKAWKGSLLVHRGDIKSAPKAKLERGPVGGNNMIIIFLLILFMIIVFLIIYFIFDKLKFY